MMGLLERIFGRRSPRESGPAPANDSAAATAPGAPVVVPGDDDADRTRSVIVALRQEIALASGGRHEAGQVDPEAEFFDHGYLDSFSYVRFLAFIEQEYSIRIDDSQLAGRLNTIAAMASHIVREEASRK